MKLRLLRSDWVHLWGKGKKQKKPTMTWMTDDLHRRLYSAFWLSTHRLLLKG